MSLGLETLIYLRVLTRKVLTPSQGEHAHTKYTFQGKAGMSHSSNITVIAEVIASSVNSMLYFISLANAIDQVQSVLTPIIFHFTPVK